MSLTLPATRSEYRLEKALVGSPWSQRRFPLVIPDRLRAARLRGLSDGVASFGVPSAAGGVEREPASTSGSSDLRLGLSPRFPSKRRNGTNDKKRTIEAADQLAARLIHR